MLASGPIAIFSGLLPVSISGIGTRDATLAYLLRDVAAPETVVAATMLYTVLAYWFLAALGAVVLRSEIARALRVRRGEAGGDTDQSTGTREARP